MQLLSNVQCRSCGDSTTGVFYWPQPPSPPSFLLPSRSCNDSKDHTARSCFSWFSSALFPYRFSETKKYTTTMNYSKIKNNYAELAQLAYLS
mmetsp:Transcript_2149/g.3304  ORF Transcript_2149/g.3304 Transcript_2149/m.3304 type:complete len:92 (-) Transcript_2149:30-305(-)